MKETTEGLVNEALARVRQNITDHVFLEIQRDVKLLRQYVNLVANDDDESKYGEVNRQIALHVERKVKGVTNDESVTPMSSLIQSFTCFKQDTVEVKAES